MNKQIILSKEKKEQIVKDFKTTSVTLWSALTFKTNSSRAKMLRGVAIERGGVLYCESYNAHFYQKKDKKTGTITQHFGDAVKLTIDTQTAQICLYVDGDKKTIYHNLSAVELANLQVTAYNINMQKVSL